MWIKYLRLGYCFYFSALQGIRGTCEQKIFLEPATLLVPLLIAGVAIRVHLAAKWVQGLISVYWVLIVEAL